MGSKAEILRQKCEALELCYVKLRNDFYCFFQLKQINDSLPASPLNTIIVTKKGEKQKMEQLFIEVRTLIASALDAYMVYKNSWFSDEKYAEYVKGLINKVSIEYDKTRYFFDSYKIIEE